MLDNVRIINPNGVEKTFSFTERTDGVEAAIEGNSLGPVTASIPTSSNASGFGVHMGNPQVGARNIVIRMTLHRTLEKTVEDVRHGIYALMPVGSEMTLEFHSGSTKYTTTGIVESNEPEIFTKNPTIRISILCGKSYFAYNDGGSLTIPPTEDGVVSHYLGSVSNGYVYTINVLGSRSYVDSGIIVLEKTLDNGYRQGLLIDEKLLLGRVGSYLHQDDQVIIDTTNDNRSGYVKMGAFIYDISGSLRNLQGNLPKEADWPIFQPLEKAYLTYNSTVYDRGSLDVHVDWVDKVQGL